MARTPKTGKIDAIYTVKKMGMDSNGNHSVWVSFRDGRAKKIQTLQNLPLTHRDRELTPRVIDEISDFVHSRKINPAPRVGTARPRRVSQVTKKPPTKRLVTRRKANVKAGYFPNPDSLEQIATFKAKTAAMKGYVVVQTSNKGVETIALFNSHKNATIAVELWNKNALTRDVEFHVEAAV